MTIKTNVPAIQFTPQGLILPTDQEILQGVMADFNAAFGGELSQNLETPQGQLASSIAAIIADKNNQIAWLVNNLDPTYADGIMQDAIGNIYFIKRKGQINSVVVCEFTGLPGTIIPKGFIVKDTNGNDWVLNEEISILEQGKVSGTLTANGIYGAKAGTVTKIYQTIIGLDRITNLNDAITGTEKESRNDFAERYKKSVAKNSKGTPESVFSNIAELDGVIDVYVVDNPKGEPVQIGATNYTLKPHSLYAAVVGGDAQKIAETILTYAGNGCDFNGNTEITLYDETYTDPKPSYQVSFMRPTPTNVYFKVKVRRDTAIIGYEEAVRKAIVSFNKEKTAKIGSTLYAIQYVPAVIAALPNSNVLSVEIGASFDRLGEEVTFGIDQHPIVSNENIMVVAV